MESKGNMVVFSDHGHFADRRDAGLQLGALLRNALRNGSRPRTIVAGIPRGGIMVAADAASVIGCDLDVIGATPLISPVDPEIPFGAVAEDGAEALSPFLPDGGMGHDWAFAERRRKRAEISHRMESIRTAIPTSDWSGARVLIVDDTASTPWLLAASAETARLRGAAEVVVAVPCAPIDVCHELTDKVQLVVAGVATQGALRSPLEVYRRFPHVTFGEMMEKLRNAGVRTRAS